MSKTVKKQDKTSKKQGKAEEKQENKLKKQEKAVKRNITVKPIKIAEIPKETAEERAERLQEEREAREEREQEDREAREQLESELSARAVAEGLTAPRPASSMLESDDYDTIYNIKESLISAGVPVNAEKKFIVSKKESSNKFSYQKTYYNDMPELSVIGEELRGGEFMVSVHAEIDGKKQIVKNYYFSVSIDQFPIVPKPIAGQVTGQPVQSAETALLLESIRQTNESIKEMAQATNKGSGLKEIIEIMTAIKAMTPPPVEQPKINYAEVIKMQGDMFKEGLKYAKELNENSDKEDIGDVLLNMAKNVSEKIDLSALLTGGNKPALHPQVQQISAGQNSKQPKPVQGNNPVTLEKALEILNDYFQDVVIGFESELEVNPYILAERVKKNPKFKVIDNFVTKLTDEKIFATLMSDEAGELKVKLENAEFYNYVKTIIDIIRRFDILELTDEGDVVLKEVKPVIQPEIKDDNSRQPATEPNTTGKSAENTVGSDTPF